MTDPGFRRNVIIAFVAVFVFGPFMWMAMDRKPPYAFEHVEIEPAEVVQGGTIRITFTVKQNRAPCGPGLVYREFKEVKAGKLHVFDPIMRTEAPIIVDNKFTRTAPVPESISPGQTIYRGTACYSCNPVHSWLRWPVCAPTPSAEFTILEKKPLGAGQ